MGIEFTLFDAIKLGFGFVIGAAIPAIILGVIGSIIAVIIGIKG